ncbi:DNA-processing protein DprA [Agrobacterium pusense]|uniref:DNA-processing protein DprA n=1 Tax=Agrobacterium pusense TaxID=648995 RepID=UPI0028B25864|nr:DNA-processing protein DprA [Agrobacterium pusense]
MEALAPDTQATILLTCKLGTADEKPLSLAEYNKVARQLMDRNLRPSDLLREQVQGFAVSDERLRLLLNRGAALALTVERWSQAGIHVVSRSDDGYPLALRRKLRSRASPLIFYSGDINILESSALCVVGSRDATETGLEFAGNLGRLCAKQRFVVVSGDARGIDREAMQAAMDDGGRAVGVLAEAMLQAVLSRRNRAAIISRKLLLLTPFEPESRFSVARAMERNKYLYALADAAVVVDSDVKGGTWSGAIENQKYGWTPAFVRFGADTGAGNRQLAAQGLVGLSDKIDQFPPLDVLIKNLPEPLEREAEFQFDKPSKSLMDGEALRDFFSALLLKMLGRDVKSTEDIASHFRLEKQQADRWLKELCEARMIEYIDDAGGPQWRVAEQSETAP